jgi:hypothetical protein
MMPPTRFDSFIAATFASRRRPTFALWLADAREPDPRPARL